MSNKNSSIDSKQTTGLDLSIELARELLQVLEKEHEALKRFDRQSLLELVPRKSATVETLHQQLMEQFSSNAHSPLKDYGSKRLQLRSLLMEIEQKNQINHSFVKESLSFCEDLLRCYLPATYDRTQEKHSIATAKGLSFSREV